MAKYLAIPLNISRSQAEFLRGMYWCTASFVGKDRVGVRDIRLVLERWHEERGDNLWKDPIRELKQIEKQEKLAEIEQLEV